jgi:type IV secretory pathway VirB9-like protein
MTVRVVTAILLTISTTTVVPRALAQGTVPNVAVPTVAQIRPPASRGAAGLPQSTGVQLPPLALQPSVPPQLLNSTEADIDQQTRGQFPTMDRAPSLPLGTLQRSWDKPSPASGQTAPGVVHYIWHPDFIMSVRTRDFMVTTLMLPSWERVNEFYVGDPLVFEAKRVRPNVLAIRSRNAGADSNLAALGASGNLYNFYLRSETWNSTQVSDLTVYVDAPRGAESGEAGSDAGSPDPADDGQAGSAAGMSDYLRRIVFRPEDLKFDMKMYARRELDAEIAPERVFEDGIFTYFDFGERSDSIGRPVLHQVVDGVDTVVNTRTAGAKGNVLIAEAVGDFILRNGNRVVCIKRLGPRQASPAVEIVSSIPDASQANRTQTGGKER